MIYYNKGKMQKFQAAGPVPVEKKPWWSWGSRSTSQNKAPEYLSDAELAALEARYESNPTGEPEGSNIRRHQKAVIDKARAARQNGTVQQSAQAPATLTTNGPERQRIERLAATNSPSPFRQGPERRLASQKAWRAAQADPNFDPTNMMDFSKYNAAPVAEEQPYQFGQDFKAYNPAAGEKSPYAKGAGAGAGKTDDGKDYYRNDQQRDADPSSIADGAKKMPEAIDTSPYKDYLGKLSMDEVADIVKYGTKKGYNKDQISSMMKVGAEQTELAEKYGYTGKIDGLPGKLTNTARTAALQAKDREEKARLAEAEEIAKKVSPEVITTEDPEEAAAKANYIYSPRQINQAFRQDRRADRADRREIRRDQRALDRAERKEIDPIDRRMDRQMDRAARKNVAKHSRVNDRADRNSIRDEMLLESSENPAISNFKKNIAIQAKKKGGIFYN